MRIASTAVLTALGLVVLAHGGVLACGASDGGGGGAEAAGAGAGGAAAGSAGGPAAGAPAGGAVNMGGGGSSAAGSAGVAGSAAGSGGAAAGAGGSAGSAGGSGGSAGTAGAGGGTAGGAGMGGTGGGGPFALTSTTFMAKAGCTGQDAIASCDRLTLMYELTTIGGQNHSPELQWTPGPAGTMSYAISLYDDQNKYTHWAIWNIPATTNMLPASLAGGDSPNGITGAKQVSFNGDKTAYAGPGATSHVYEFKLYALKVPSITISLTGDTPQIDARNKLEASTDVLATSVLRVASSK